MNVEEKNCLIRATQGERSCRERPYRWGRRGRPDRLGAAERRGTDRKWRSRARRHRRPSPAGLAPPQSSDSIAARRAGRTHRRCHRRRPWSPGWRSLHGGDIIPTLVDEGCVLLRRGSDRRRTRRLGCGKPARPSWPFCRGTRARTLSALPSRRIAAAVDQRSPGEDRPPGGGRLGGIRPKVGRQVSRPPTVKPTSTADFSQAFDVPRPQTIQVPRARFDQILLEHAARSGARVLEGHTTKEAEFDRDGVRVTHAGADGSLQSIRVAAVIDASGRAGFLAKRFGERRKDPLLQNISVHGQVRGNSSRRGSARG